MDIVEMGIVMGAWFLGAFVNVVSGLGCSLLAVPIIAVFLDSKELVVVSSLNGFLVGTLTFFLYWRKIDIRKDALFWTCYVLGAPFGVWALMALGMPMLQLFLGFLLFSYVVWRVRGMFCGQSMLRMNLPSWSAAVFGGAGGFAMGAVSVGGPPLILYADLKGFEKDRARGFFACGPLCFVYMLPAMFIHGLINTEVLMKVAYTLPAMFLGMVVAWPVAKRINQVWFNRGMIFLMGIAAVSLLVKSCLYYTRYVLAF